VIDPGKRRQHGPSRQGSSRALAASGRSCRGGTVRRVLANRLGIQAQAKAQPRRIGIGLAAFPRSGRTRIATPTRRLARTVAPEELPNAEPTSGPTSSTSMHLTARAAELRLRQRHGAPLADPPTQQQGSPGGAAISCASRSHHLRIPACPSEAAGRHRLRHDPAPRLADAAKAFLDAVLACVPNWPDIIASVCASAAVMTTYAVCRLLNQR
jgi:hypothetical protein